MASEIDDYFARFTYQPAPAAGTKPLEIVWKRVGELEVKGSRLYIGDSWAILGESIELPISPGLYDIDAKCVSYGTDGRVALLRGRLRDCEPDGSREAGEFGVDVASAGMIDADALDRWAQADEKAYEEWQDRFSQTGAAEIVGFYPCKAIGSAMVFTSTGFGDGVYRAITLLEGDRPVGFEAHFLRDDEGYFETHAGEKPGPWKLLGLSVLTVIGAFFAIVFGVLFGLIAKLFSRRR